VVGRYVNLSSIIDRMHRHLICHNSKL
jgi:hypothetical protein